MQTITKFILVLTLIGFSINPLLAQTTILNQTLLTQESFSSFTVINVTGAQVWNFNPQYGAVCSGYSAGQNFENEDWLISPVMNLSQTDNVQLTFSHTRGNAAVMNAGVSQGWYKVFATANYTENPLTTQWVELTGLNQNITEAWEFVSSGNLVIPAAARSGQTRIAFRYISSDTQSAMWEIKNVKVTGTYQGGNPGSGAFKVTNWNTEWLGCETNGPTNETLQMNNVATAMLAMDSDIYCIQEVSDTPSNPTIQTLVSMLGSDEWGGAIVPLNTGDCNQRQGIIYKKSRVQFLNAMELSSGNAAQGNSYYYNWSSGRFPALYNVNFVSGGTSIPVTIVNIHAKAEDGNPMSHTRRTGASEGLKAILDSPNYNNKNVIIIGDFNDFLVGTTSEACNCTVSPYSNFMNDAGNYTGITQYITDADISWGTEPIIENIIISNELADDYAENSAMQEVNMWQVINNYSYTTSNHLPVSATFQFPTLSTPDYTFYGEDRITIYPNPVNDVLNVKIPDDTANTAIEIFDVTGRKVYNDNSGNYNINVSALPAGMYIVKAGNRSGKFVKE